MQRLNTPNPKYVVALAVAAVLILLVGGLFRPRARSAEQPPPSDTDLARLVRLTERRALDSAAALLTQVADDVAPALVWLGPAATSGVVWTGNTIAAGRFEPAAAPPLVVTSVAGEATVARVDWSPDLPLTRVELTEPTSAPPARRAAAPAQPGASVIAVWRTAPGRVFAPATFIDAVAAPCGDRPSREVRTTLALTSAMAGGGLFDLDGGLLGVILPCGDRHAAVVPDVIDGLFLTAESFESRLGARYGLVVEALTAPEAAAAQVDSGVNVTALRIGGPAAAAGLRPGDLVVGLDGAAVTRVEDLRPLVMPTPVQEAVLSIRRESAALAVTVADGQATPAASAPLAGGSAGVVWASPRPGFLVEAVQSGSPAAAAGLQAGDRVVRLGSREPQDLDQVRRALEVRAGTAIFVEFERDGYRRGTLVSRAAR